MKHVQSWSLYESTNNATGVAMQLIGIMNLDNRTEFDYDSKIFVKLRNAVKRMLDAGWDASEKAIEDIAAGEEGENEELYGHYDGFVDVNQTLADIFDPPEAMQNDAQLALKYPKGFAIYQQLEVGTTFVQRGMPQQQFTITNIEDDKIDADHDFASDDKWKKYSFNKDTLINNLEYDRYILKI